jgi:hypothetical protein
MLKVYYILTCIFSLVSSQGNEPLVAETQPSILQINSNYNIDLSKKDTYDFPWLTYGSINNR